MKASHALALAALTVLAACSGGHGARVYPAFEQGPLFLCCTLRFNKDHDQSDAGYEYPGETLLSAGTPVAVVKDEERELMIQPLGETAQYHMVFRYGRLVISPAQYFQQILLREDPRGTLAEAKPDIATAIAEGRLVVGMTRAEAIAARGYPPRHRTPDLSASPWLYYASRDTAVQVTFSGDRIVEIAPVPAPGS